MIFEIEIKNTENIIDLTEEQLNQIYEIIQVLITTGSLTGVKGGSANIMFDGYGRFGGVRLDYMPYKKVLTKRDY